MRKRLRHMRRDEGGSVLVMIAILLPVMLGMAALAIDVAGWYQTRRQLQSAADAAALAGMQDLPTSATASTDAQNYVIKNASGAGTTVTTPFNSDSNQIKVTVTKSYPSIFGGLLGLGSVQISASAVAKKTGTGSSKSALFASNTACGGTNGVYIVSNNVNVIGGTHSNGNLYLNANNDQLGPTSYGGPNGCSYSNYGNNNTFGGPGRRSRTRTPRAGPRTSSPTRRRARTRRRASAGAATTSRSRRASTAQPARAESRSAATTSSATASRSRRPRSPSPGTTSR